MKIDHEQNHMESTSLTRVRVTVQVTGHRSCWLERLCLYEDDSFVQVMPSLAIDALPI